MPDLNQGLLNIGIVGGGTRCGELVSKTSQEYLSNGVNARVVAIYDADSTAPCIPIAKGLNIPILYDYNELYNPKYGIHLIIVLDPDEFIFNEILRTKPPHIRALSFHVFELFWRAIGMEEMRLRQRNEEIETILNGIQDFILVITPDREIVEANQAFLTQMGYRREQVIGKKCHEIFQMTEHPCNSSEMVCPLSEVIRNKHSCRRELTRVNSKGEKRYTEVSIFPIWEKGGKILRFIEISRDVTERRQQEEQITKRLEQMVEERTKQIREIHEKLLHQDKMASLGKLSASVVHEINNPITGILNLLMLIKRISEEDNVNADELTQFKRYIDLMESETKRISRIVSNLLAFSRQAKTELSEIELNVIIDKTIFLNSNLMKIHSIKVQKELQPDLPKIVASEDQLQQIFMNMISNAVEAMEPKGGGTISIVTRLKEKEGKVLIAFSDTGVGIETEDISRVFEPFFTTKKKGKGVGLGLSVVYGIIQDHGGSIQVESHKDKGTVFTIELPLERKSVHSGARRS